MKKRHLFFLFLLGGCMVGPNYQAPEIQMPVQFVEGAAPISDEELICWWKQFGDLELNALVEEVMRGNYDLQIALEKISEARAQFQIQSSALWPSIDLNAIAVRQRYSQTLFTSTGNAVAFASGVTSSGIGAITGPPVQNFFHIGFDAVWELDFWGKFRRGKQAAFDLWEASFFNADAVRLAVVAEAIRNYIHLRSLDAQIQLLQDKIAVDARILELLQVLFQAGLDNQIDVQNSLALLESDQAELPVLKTQRQQTIYALAILMGKQPEECALAFEEKRPLPVFVGKVPAGLPSDLLRRRPDIRISERELAAATEQTGIAIAGLFPSISLTGDGFGSETNTFPKLWNKKSAIWTIGPNIQWNLIDFGKIRGQIASAQSTQKQALLSYEQTVIQALQDVEGALVAYFDEQKRSADLSNQREANEKALVLTHDLFQAGLVSEIQELQAKRALIETQSTLLISEGAVASDLVSLYKALGGTWECSSTL